MKYTVVMLARAEADAEEIFTWLAARSRAGAERWFAALCAAQEQLQTLSELCSKAREGRLYGRELRQILVGAHRVISFVDRSTVKIVTIRHASRLPAQLDDL